MEQLNNMRVGIIAAEFPPDVGGVETYSYEFAKELSRRGYEVTVFTIPHKEGEISMPGVKILPILMRDSLYDWEKLKEYIFDKWHVMNAGYVWLAGKVAPVIVSVVHGNDFLNPYILTERLRFSRLPILWRLETKAPGVQKIINKWLTSRSIKRWLPKTMHILVNSLYTEQALIKKYPACKGKTVIAYVGVANDFFAAEHVYAANDVKRLITVCRLDEERKNIDLTLRALAGLKDKYRFSYTVIGEGRLRVGLENLSRELGLEKEVIFTGHLSKDTLKRLYASSDLFIMTSSVGSKSFEGFGITYLEANACGTPVLAARVGGAAEAVKEGISGMFVENPTVEEIRIALERFLSGQVKFEPRACKEFAHQFTWAKIVDKAMEFYK